MEKQTRMSKYKDLRERVREEMDVQSVRYETQNKNEQDDYLSFMIVNDDHEEETVNNDYMTKEYDKKMEILQKIKEIKEDEQQPQRKQSLLEKLAKLSKKEDVEELKVYEKQVEETAEEVNEEVNEEVIEETPSETSGFNFMSLLKGHDEQEVQAVEEKNTKTDKIINGIIVVLIILFFVFIAMIIKQLFL